MSSRERKYRHPDSTGLKRYARSTEEMTPQETADWLLSVAGDDGYEAVVSAGIYVDWYSPMSPEELKDREEYEAAQIARTEKWERETYAKLYAKYGPVPGKGF
jgi:hypothetical protein